MIELVGAFNQEKALLGAFSVIVKTGCGTDGSICGTTLNLPLYLWPGYPRELAGNNTCLAVRGRGEAGGLRTWEDGDCGDNNHFICEYLWLQELMDSSQ